MGLISRLNLDSYLSPDLLVELLKAVLYLAVGYIVLRIIVFVVRRLLKGRVTEQVKMLITRTILYAGIAFLVVITLIELGVNLTPILGAAGIVGLAVGIASQASLSNIISGLFLVSEKPFEIGDVIRSGDKIGIVQSIDLLSVKIRTFDNLYIRIPNEKIANADLVNITRFPIRRLDFDVSVAYKEDLARVAAILQEVAKADPNCLDEPAPLVLFKNFGDSGIELLFAVWFVKTDYLAVKNSVFQAIKRRFDEEGIEIPFPHRSIYAGQASEPFPVRVVGEHSGDLGVSPTSHAEPEAPSRPVQ